MLKMYLDKIGKDKDGRDYAKMREYLEIQREQDSVLESIIEGDFSFSAAIDTVATKYKGRKGHQMDFKLDEDFNELSKYVCENLDLRHYQKFFKTGPVEGYKEKVDWKMEKKAVGTFATIEAVAVGTLLGLVFLPGALVGAGVGTSLYYFNNPGYKLNKIRKKALKELKKEASELDNWITRSYRLPKPKYSGKDLGEVL